MIGYSDFMSRYIQKLKNLYHLFVAIVANLWYGFPSRRLKVIGVTGTDGKTTTTHLIYHILKTAGKKVSMVSSVYAIVGKKEYDIGFHITTPNPFALQKLLKQSIVNGDEYFILETTSHALDQFRVWGINYEVGVVTNITHEHLDYHQTFEDYVKTKAKLLLNSKMAVINESDKSYQFLKKLVQSSKCKVQSYNSKLKVLNQLSNLTEFNRCNYAAASLVCRKLGINEEIILKAMKVFKLPKGRLEVVYDKEFKIIIDFAHTPNAFENVLKAIKENYLNNSGRLIHVFGAAGLRDQSKRPLMGQVSGKYADLIILTEEDYRTEDPEKICQQIAEGIKDRQYLIIVDRQKAIGKAISLVKKNDIVILTGKSHEKSLCRGKTEYPWDEFEAAKTAISNLKTR